MNGLEETGFNKTKTSNRIDVTSSETKEVNYSNSDSIFSSIPKVWEKSDRMVEEKKLHIDKNRYEKIFRNESIDTILINELSKHFDSLTKNFEDLRYRQIYFSKIKEDISDLWSIKQDEGYYSELLMLLNQAVEDLRSENLDDEKVEVFEDAISRLKRGGITEEDIETLVDEFLKNGVSLVPSIPKLSDLYD